ncbi:PH domain-containing protein [Natrialbaceae archaeon GCM10025810]|uniref:PH domain-containing protein n=1 Tax=Halovalidus salilacus TaxID=3075124 RepID=UPI0036200741
MTPREKLSLLNYEPPDLGFQVGLSSYLGIVISGLVASFGVAVDVATPTLLGIVPTVFTIVTVHGVVLAKRFSGVAERIGASRWLTLACFSPIVTHGAVLLADVLGALEVPSRLFVTSGVALVFTGVAAAALASMAGNRFVDAVTREDPETTWTWHSSRRWGTENGALVVGLSFVAMAIVLGFASRNWGGGLFWAFMGLFWLLPFLSDDDTWYADADRTSHLPDLRAHDVGIVTDRPQSRRLIPWDDVEDVRLTEDELILERRFLDVRCDRAEIDDPEAVLEGIERARARGTGRPPAPATVDERENGDDLRSRKRSLETS